MHAHIWNTWLLCGGMLGTGYTHMASTLWATVRIISWRGGCGWQSEAESPGFTDTSVLPPSRWQEPIVCLHSCLECAVCFQLEDTVSRFQVFSPFHLPSCPALPTLPSGRILCPDFTCSISHLDHESKIRYTAHPVLKRSVINMIH